MAFADPRDELTCSICLSLYTDPVSLRCGHNFCCSCIVIALDTQKAAGSYSCPYCRAEYPQRPPLKKRRKLGNIVKRFLSTQPDMEDTRIFCTYCTKSPVPAVKSCLQCENSLCDGHLTAHNKMVDHILMEPTGSFAGKICSIHKKVMELYCLQDSAFLCMSCYWNRKHKGHKVERLDQVSEKSKLREYLNDLDSEVEESQTRVHNLHDHKRFTWENASDKRLEVRNIFMDLKEQLEAAEEEALSEISREEKKIVSQVSDLLKKLEIREDKLSRIKCQMEEMSHATYPIRVLQETDITVCSPGDDEDTGGDGGKISSEDDVDAGLVSGQNDDHMSDTKIQDDGTDSKTVLQESDQGAACSDENMVGEDVPVSDLRKFLEVIYNEPDDHIDDLDDDFVSLTVHQSLRDFVTDASKFVFHVADILLDVDTAHTYVKISEDLKTATYSEEEPDRAESPGRFLSAPQVLSRSGLSSGRHYWEVKWNQTGTCSIGVSYRNITKKGQQSVAGYNDESWCLVLEDKEYLLAHASVIVPIPPKPSCPTLGVFLDYEAGCLSFYELCDPIRRLHSLPVSFTEPLYAIFYVDKGASVTISTRN